jgi:hypothetical protein
MNMRKRIIAIVFGFIALSVAAYAADTGLKRAEELFRRADYERARRAASADTSSMDRSSLAAALFMLARLETDYGAAETLYRRVMASENERAANLARLELATMRYAAGDYAGALDLLSERKVEGSERDADKAAYFAALSRRQLGDNARAAAEFAGITRGDYSSWSVLAPRSTRRKGGSRRPSGNTKASPGRIAARSRFSSSPNASSVSGNAKRRSTGTVR